VFVALAVASPSAARADDGTSMGFALLGGFARPICHALDACGDHLGVAPSLQAQVSFAPYPTLALGFLGQLTRVHWHTLWEGQIAGQPPFPVDADLTVGFGGGFARFVPRPEWRVTPLFQLALGVTRQTESGGGLACHGRFSPTVQAAVGVRGRMTSSLSILGALGLASGAADECSISDAPNVPFVGWGLTFHAGVGYDLPL
jgi:hypothetical protein